MGILSLPSISKAQVDTAYVYIDTYCNFASLDTCPPEIKDNNGNTVSYPYITSGGYLEIPGFIYDPSNAPYSLVFDQFCTNNFGGIVMDEYTYPLSPYYWYDSTYNMSTWYDTLYIACEGDSNTTNVDTAYIYIDVNCDFSSADNCPPTINDNFGNIIAYTDITSSGYIDIPAFIYDPNNAPYSLVFDQTCVNAAGITMSEYQYPLSPYYWNDSTYNYGGWSDTLYLSCEGDSNVVTNPATVYVDSCSWNNVNCPVSIRDVNGNSVYEAIYTSTLSMTFNYNSANAPYSIFFDEDCFNEHNVYMDVYEQELEFVDYGFMLYANVSTNCYDSTIGSGCVDLYTSVSPWIGYYQNYNNSVYFNWGNNSNTSENATITITIPPGVTPLAYSFDYPYTVSGSQLILNTTLAPYGSYSDVIYFSVPGGLTDGTMHSYGIQVTSSTTDCYNPNNDDVLCMILGNSYDPNDKTVNQPEQISAFEQEEFTYRIRFQNTGTAPAQDIYIIDTLSDNLDWTTFQLVESSHNNLVVTDLGNGIKRFTYDDIWLPDSTSNLIESQGFVTYKIKEKASNVEGSEIFNTAYIYFDANPAIVTNTTYSINASNLGVSDLGKINTITLFPNPATSTVNVKSDAVIEKIEVYSATGKLCLESTPSNVATNLNVNDFAPGIYMINVQTGTETSTLRFIKK